MWHGFLARCAEDEDVSARDASSCAAHKDVCQCLGDGMGSATDGRSGRLAEFAGRGLDADDVPARGCVGLHVILQQIQGQTMGCAGARSGADEGEDPYRPGRGAEFGSIDHEHDFRTVPPQFAGQVLRRSLCQQHENAHPTAASLAQPAQQRRRNQHARRVVLTQGRADAQDGETGARTDTGAEAVKSVQCSVFSVQGGGRRAFIASYVHGFPEP